MKLNMPDLPEFDQNPDQSNVGYSAPLNDSNYDQNKIQFPPVMGRRFTLSTLRNLPAKWGNRTALKLIVFATMFGLGAFFINQRINVDQPIITLENPEEDAQITDDKVLVKGKVEPSNSEIKINDTQTVHRNGDGTFTALVNLKEGENVLSIEAKKFSKKSSIIRLVQRELSQAELSKKQEEDQKLADETQKEQQLSKLTQGFGSVAGTNSSDGKSGVVLANVQLLSDLSPVRIIGEAVNQLNRPVSNVRVSALFKDSQGKVVDLVSDFVPINDGLMDIGQKLPFELRTIKKSSVISTYDFEVTWE